MMTLHGASAAERTATVASGTARTQPDTSPATEQTPPPVLHDADFALLNTW
jgi:hypothetical protein